MSKESVKASQIKYKTSDKGKETIKKYRKMYEKIEKRKKYLKKYRQKLEQKARVKNNNEKFFKSEKGREYMRQWRRTPKGKAKSNYDCAMRRARKLKATPPWLTKEHRSEIRQIYNRSQEISIKTGILHHVDHIIPLAGLNVCGLHVPWNLQIIEGKENCRKNNKLES